MRIISGTHKGRPIRLPSVFHARPTTDFAKTGLFNILANRIDFSETTVLDLFSGTGSISYEFASRGSAKVEFVESDALNFSFIEKTAAAYKLNAIKGYRTDAFFFLKRCASKYDLIFADPPYDLQGIATIPELVFQNSLLNEGGYLIVEHSGNISFDDHPRFKEKREYGSVNFSFFQ
jgi:16S rRNA (guanine966-N2)-methyltransferase